MKKIALINGISGQDGTYLAKFLLDKNYEVWGTSRDVQGSTFLNIQKLGIIDRINFLSMVPEDFRSVFVSLRKSSPDEVYYLAGQSSVGLSFDLPAETIQSNTIGTLNILEACRMLDKSPKIYFAGSSECFGDTPTRPASENTPFHPQSPYAVAKASSYWLVNNYREAYDLFASTGILFNHESPLRPDRFVTQKIIATARRIANGSKEILELGRLDIIRDWGWAPEYVEAMWLILQQEIPEDYVISSGESNSLESFVIETFNKFGLDSKRYVRINPKLVRPKDLLISRGDATKAYKKLGWKAKYKMRDVINFMTSLEK